MTIEFTELALHPTLVQGLTELGYTKPTPIQAGIIPLMLEGQDVVGQAQTGTGKTAAFALPMLHRMTPDQKQVQGLILTPTRELAMQVTEAIYQYGHPLNVRVLAIYGGQSYRRQISRLKRGVDIVIGTPGRLLDLINQQILDLSGVATVVLDEADEMLSMGFIADIEAILSKTPYRRQTALFSATLPQAVRRLAEQYMRDPQSVTVPHEQLTVEAIEQCYYLVNEADRLAALTRLFEVEEIQSALIFTRTRIGTEELATALTGRGFPAKALSGDLNQEARERVLNRFRNNQIKVLVATDVAARGLDIDDISHVFNYELPQDPEIYVHRVGRTGRAGKSGKAISLLTPREQWMLRRIEGYARQKISRATLPTIEAIQQHRETQLIEQMLIWLRRGRCRQERKMVDTLVAEGYDANDIAAAALKLARAEEKQRPIAPVSEVQERTLRRENYKNRRGARHNERDHRQRGQHKRDRHSNFYSDEGMIRLTLNTGKVDGVRVNNIVGTIARYADIPGSALGKIHIQQRRTLVDVPEEFVEQVLAKNGRYRIGEQPIEVTRA